MNRTMALGIWASILLVLASCGKPQKDSVWNIYDYRHPVPAASAVPAGDPARRYYIQDNDSSYTPPNNYNCLSSSNIFCE